MARRFFSPRSERDNAFMGTLRSLDWPTADAPSFGLYTDTDMASIVQSFDSISESVVILRRKAPTIPAGLSPGVLVRDCELWRHGFAEAHRPTAVHDDAAIQGLWTSSVDEWIETAVRPHGIDAALTPSLFVRPNDWGALGALVSELGTVTHEAAVRFVPTDAAMLDAERFEEFLRLVAPLSSMHVAFLFAGAKEALAYKARLRNLRRLIRHVPDTWILGVDPLVASDAVTHGAAQAFVGVRSGMRWPDIPGESNGGYFAKDYIPGLFNRELLATRSPSVFADWYVASPAPKCGICGRAADDYTSFKPDKEAVVAHNIHAISDFGAEIAAQAEGRRGTWLHDQRIAAFEAHAQLNRAAATFAVDNSLRWLVELDDVHRRRASRRGVWV